MSSKRGKGTNGGESSHALRDLEEQVRELVQVEVVLAIRVLGEDIAEKEAAE